MEKDKKLVYVPMAADTIHPGHLNIIKISSELGRVMVGLFTDEAIASYKKLPVMNYEQRKAVIESIKGVDVVVPQESRDYEPNLRKYKPAFMVHGTDWKEGPLSEVRKRAIDIMDEWGGKIIEPEYTRGISSSSIHAAANKDGVSIQCRQEKLRNILNLKPFIYFVGAYDGLSALLSDQTNIKRNGEPLREFDAICMDRDSCALAKGVMGQEVLDPSEYFAIIDAALTATLKPIIAMSWPFCSRNQFIYEIRRYERMGVSGLIIQSKDSTLEIEEKVRLAKEKRMNKFFLIIPEIEFEQTDASEQQIVEMVNSYMEAGADGIIFTGKFQSIDKISTIVRLVRKDYSTAPLIASPAGKAEIRGKTLHDIGFQGILYKECIVQHIYSCIKKQVENLLS